MEDETKISAQCPYCRSRYSVAAALAGRRLRCKSCDQWFLLNQTALTSSDHADRPASGKYVFVSYCRKDQEQVLNVVECLRQAGVSVWIDQEGIEGASFWAEEIVNAIRKCTVFMFMISREGVESSNTNRELAIAAERNLTILPVYLAQIELPARTAFLLAGIHHVEITGGLTPRTVKALFQSLQRAGIQIGPSPPTVEPGAHALVGLTQIEESAVAPVPLVPPAKRPASFQAKISPPSPSPDPVPEPRDHATTPQTQIWRPSDSIGSILCDATPFCETRMSKLYAGTHPDVGPAILKVMKELPPESIEWLESDLYRDVMGDRLLEMGVLPSGEGWILSRRVPGVVLSDLIRSRNVIMGGLLDTIFLEIVTQLVKLHGAIRPVIHRDVTPGNFMLNIDLASESRGLSVQLIDYESACFVDSVQTPFGATGFAPREQLNGQAVLSSDLYSLVSSTYYMASAKVPHENFLSKRKPSFPQNAWGVDTRLDILYGGSWRALKCWDNDPQERCESAVEFLEQKPPASRCIVPPKAIGKFVYSPECTLRLFDGHFEIERS